MKICIRQSKTNQKKLFLKVQMARQNCSYQIKEIAL